MPWFAALAGGMVGGAAGAYGIASGKNKNEYTDSQYAGHGLGRTNYGYQESLTNRTWKDYEQ